MWFFSIAGVELKSKLATEICLCVCACFLDYHLESVRRFDSLKPHNTEAFEESLYEYNSCSLSEGKWISEGKMEGKIFKI